MPTARMTDGSDLYYEVHGDGPRALAFAHGAGGNRLSWWQQVPYFQDRYRCVIFDHRGFGQSTDATNLFIRGFRGDLEVLLNHLGIDEVALVGQSMGGFTCLTFAAAHPERVKALVMADTLLGVGDESLLEPLREVWRGLQTPNSSTQTVMVGPDFIGSNPAGLFLYQAARRMNPERSVLADYSVADGAIPVADLSRLTVPTLFLAGEDDAVIPAHLIEQAARDVPGARYVEVPEAGHSVYWERPAEFNQILDGFLAATYPASD